MNLKKITILGPPGSGKSYLAKELGKKLSIPIVHFDMHLWKPDWVKADSTEFRTNVMRAMGEKWITDGNHLKDSELTEYVSKKAT